MALAAYPVCIVSNNSVNFSFMSDFVTFYLQTMCSKCSDDRVVVLWRPGCSRMQLIFCIASSASTRSLVRLHYGETYSSLVFALATLMLLDSFARTTDMLRYSDG